MTDNIKDITPLIIEGIQDRKGRGITVIDMEGIHSSPARKFVICQGTSTSQVSAIADSIRDTVLNGARRKPYHEDGYRNAQWIILDYGETLIHIFLPDVREHYNLEELWGDGKITLIPDLD